MIVQIKRVVEGALCTILLASLLPAAEARNRRPNGIGLISNALSDAAWRCSGAPPASRDACGTAAGGVTGCGG